jgi:hypothetical protein
MTFVALEVLGVELQNILEVQGQDSNDQKSWASNCKLVLLTYTELQLECNYNLSHIGCHSFEVYNYLSLGALLLRINAIGMNEKKCLTLSVKLKFSW